MHNNAPATLPRTAFRTALVKIHLAGVARWMILLAGGLLCFVCASSASANATTEGNVLLSSDGGTTFFADDPFTTVNEGIPTAGNSINENQGTNQINFEGRPDTKGTATVTDDENINFDIYVGLTSYGLLTINGGTEVRDMNLIIGDSDTLPGSSILRRGTGYVRIENPGSVFNNDPSILPFPFYLTGDSPSINDRTVEPGATDGFDLFVGRSGTGDLAISLGGRAEIQDAVIVGDLGGSVGTMTIDGVSSFLQSGGFEVATLDPDVANYMVVGRLGSGTMSITNGGQSYNSGAITTTGGDDEVFAAVVGSDFAAVDNSAPGAGGQGTVVVDGISSKWTVAGNLQVGGFHNNRIGVGPLAVEDLDGNDVQYFAGTGRGTLRVSNDALVSVVTPPLDDGATNVPNRLDLLVGRFGRIELDGGRIELLGAFDSSDPTNPTQELTHGRLINDGVVSGHGNITVLQFRNRVFGEVRVSAAQKLRIDSIGLYAETDNIPVPGEPEYPLSNYGLIEVIGTETARAEIHFARSPGTGAPTNDPIRPFLNLPLLGPPSPGNGRTGGEIVAQDSIMRFDSGIDNRHKVTFTGGSNEVVGNFVNDGTVTVSGDNTSVVFVDQFFNNGTLELAPNISLVTFIDDVTFAGSGSLNTSFGGRPTGQEINHIVSAEDIVLGGTLNVSLFTSPGVPGFNPQDGDRFELISSAADLIGDFTTVNIPCVGTICFVGVPDYTLDSYFIQAFEITAMTGPDLNGDGQVDQIDYNIWRSSVGNTGVPGTVIGDINGDGVVNSADYTIWRDNCCGPFPGAGGGSGLGLGSGAVPEPASCMLLASAGLLAFAFGRRRAS